MLSQDMKDYSLTYRKHWLDCIIDTLLHMVIMMSNEAEKIKTQLHASTDRSMTLGKNLEGNA